MSAIAGVYRTCVIDGGSSTLEGHGHEGVNTTPKRVSVELTEFLSP